MKHLKIRFVSRYRSENNFVIPSKYVKRSDWFVKMSKSFAALSSCLSVLYNYFDEIQQNNFQILSYLL